MGRRALQNNDLYVPAKGERSVVQQIEALFATVEKAGGRRMIYHLPPPFYSPVSSRAEIFHFGWPDEFVRYYIEEQTFLLNPVPDLVMRLGHSTSWQEAILRVKPSREQRKHLRDLAELGLEDGVASPLFGAHGRDAFIAIDLGRILKFEDIKYVRSVIMEAQFTHRRICSILDSRQKASINLSEREEEVLGLIGIGKTSAEIAKILQISKETVNTYTKRIFEKLQVNDRTSAVIKGLRHGLILFH